MKIFMPRKGNMETESISSRTMLISLEEDRMFGTRKNRLEITDDLIDSIEEYYTIINPTSDILLVKNNKA